MIFNCQRKGIPFENCEWQTHQVEAPDEATARVMMFNRSNARAWLDLNKTLVWSTEDWRAI